MSEEKEKPRQEKMRNPYEDEIPLDEVNVPRSLGWIVVAVFLLVCTGPPLWRNLFDSGKPAFLQNGEQFGVNAKWRPVREILRTDSPLAVELLASKKAADPRIRRGEPDILDHLHSFEAQLEKAQFRKPASRWYQRLVTGLLREGGGKAFLGRDDTLFYRPALDALLGYGPLRPEPDTVAKDPNRPPWNSPREAVLAFHRQLQERGVELMLVPVPVKPMIYPERIGGGGYDGPVRHPDAARLFEELAEAGIEVVDLADTYWSWKNEGDDLFLKQDTHWTPATMERTAAEIAKRIEEWPWFGELDRDLKTRVERRSGTHEGDLVGMLELGDKAPFDPEAAGVGVVIDEETGQSVSLERASPVVLLGDSFVNIFHSRELGFSEAAGGEETIGGGFAQHLAAELGIKIDAHVANGGGASEVRNQLGRRYDDEVRAKKLVVWVLASRDLLLSETPAADAGVWFTDTKFNPKKDPNPGNGGSLSGKGVVIEGAIVARSANGDPTATPYKQSLYAAHLKLSPEAAEKLGATDPECVAYLWAFRDRKLVPSSALEVGKSYRLRLSPWSEVPSLHSVNRNDDLGLFLDEYFAELESP